MKAEGKPAQRMDWPVKYPVKLSGPGTVEAREPAMHIVPKDDVTQPKFPLIVGGRVNSLFMERFNKRTLRGMATDILVLTIASTRFLPRIIAAIVITALIALAILTPFFPK